MTFPTRNEIVVVIQRMLSGELTRNEASEWACTWILNDARVSDNLAWDAIKLLGAADLVSTDHPYLYNEEDFVEVMSKLTQEISS
jgi:hypothetical protein